MISPVTTWFIGTHAFAAAVLDGLITIPDIRIEKVITQPDKPAGRKKELTPPPVKIAAERLQIPIEQPSTLKTYSLSTPPELIIVAQYGNMIPPHILTAPKYGVLNTHTSLLPLYRGASPIQSAIMNGEQKTGVTIMKMDEGLDTGPILLQKEIEIFPSETYTQLDARLAQLSITALREAIPLYINGQLLPKEQQHNQATQCRQFTREDGEINWQQTTKEIYNQWRGLTPWPGVWTMWEQKRIKLLSLMPDTTHACLPGEVHINKKELYIGTADGSLRVDELQLEGKPAMTAAQFIAGYGSRIHGVRLPR